MNKTMYAAGLAGAVVLSGLVHGEETADAGQMIEEVIVTAQKRSESLQDVPFTVTAINNADLRRMGVSDLRDISAAASNVSITNDKTGIQIAIRGVTNNENVPPSTALHADGIYSGIPQSGMLAFLDVERVEVLKGPQGTLYGRNSTAGAINVISKRPNLTEIEGRVDAVAGDYGLFRTEGGINVPIVEGQLAVRLSGLYEDREGYIEHDGFGVPTEDSDNRDNKAFKARLLWTPTERVSWLLGAETGSQEGPGPRMILDFAHMIPFQEQVGKLIQAGEAAGLPNLGFLHPQNYYNLLPQDIQARIASDVRFSPVSPVNTLLLATPPPNGVGFPPPIDPSQFVSSAAAYPFPIGGLPVERWAYDIDSTSDAYLSDLRIDFDAFELNFLAGYRDFAEMYLGSGGSWGVNLLGDFDYKDTEQSYELRVSGGDRLYWQAGLYYYELESEEERVILGELYFIDEQSLGLFGTSTFELSDSLRLTAGVRYSEDEIDGAEYSTATLEAPPIESAVDFQNWSGRLSLDWDVSAESMLYATVSSGYKTGGVNFGSTQNPRFDEETVITYEVGSKSTLLDGALQLNGSVFFNDYSDLQNDGLVAELELDENGQPRSDSAGNLVAATIQVVDNVSDVEMYGAEVEWIWQATPALRVDGAFAMLETEIQKGTIADESLTGAAAVQVDVSGNKMRKAPDSSFRLGVEHTFRFPWGDLVPRLDFYWEDDVYHDLINREYDLQESWTRTDVGITYHSTDDKLLVQLWARNLEDDDIRANIRQTVVGPLSSIRPPRTYGVRVGYQF
ncbi:MAG: TonB-dependent receptor [Gammaproteobacteria bacterium]|nr:TonB-dependent receptor [Gammaproteobacteria bacterium]